MQKKLFLFITLTALSSFINPGRLIAEELTVSHLDRPPYYFLENGLHKGFLLDLTVELLKSSSIRYSLVQLSPRQILREFTQPSTPHCSIGWFKTKDRESFAKYTFPIYKNQPLVVLFLKDNLPEISKFKSIKIMMQKRNLILGKVMNYSYGQVVDRLLELYTPPLFMVKSSQKQIVKLIHQKRIVYMLIAPEEVESLILSAGLESGTFSTHALLDLPDGNIRYLMCNRLVKDDKIRTINDAIRSSEKISNQLKK